MLIPLPLSTFDMNSRSTAVRRGATARNGAVICLTIETIEFLFSLSSDAREYYV
jgi:hypothetical protein